MLLLVLQLIKTSYSQNYKEVETGFTTIFNYSFVLDSYHFGNNPAYLNFSKEDEFLSLKSNYKNDEGEFKKFTTPGIDRTYFVSASGKKAIDSVQKFKGSFGFSKLERKNWNWFFTREYETDNPFLIGDSTFGNSRINGISLNAEYVRNISQNISAGINLDYAVDEGLKTVSPRPTSQHRDIHAKIGIGYNVTNQLSFGLTADVTDKNEQISFREDEGALTQETIILKFKGYDFPNVVRKKVETRYAFTNSYSSGITSSFSSNDFSFAAFINAGFEKTSIKDDALDPKGEGFWKDDFVEAGFKGAAFLLKDLTAGFSYKYLKKDGWAKYPPANILYNERKSSSHKFIAGLENKINDKISAGIEIGMSLFSKSENDHYSIVKSSTKYNEWSGRVGVDYHWSERLSSLVSYGFMKKANLNYDLANNANSNYFNSFRRYDILYLQTAFTKHSFSFTSEFKDGYFGAMIIQLNYSRINPDAGYLFENSFRNVFEVNLEYRIKVI